MEVHSSTALWKYIQAQLYGSTFKHNFNNSSHGIGLPCDISMTGFTDVNFPQKSTSSCRQSSPDENFRKLIRNGKLRISL